MYYNDKPIEQFNEDVLGRAAFAKNLATALTNLKGETILLVYMANGEAEKHL